MKTLFLVAILFATIFTANAFDSLNPVDSQTTSFDSLNTNCVVVVENEQDSVVNTIYKITIAGNTVNFTALSGDITFSIVTTDTTNLEDYYDGYETVIDINTTSSNTVTVMYREGRLLAVGINEPNGVSTFYLHNPSLPWDLASDNQ